MDDLAYEDDGDWLCDGCGSSITLGEGCEKPGHGFCWRCSSDAVTTLRARVKELEGLLERVRDDVSFPGCVPYEIIKDIRTALKATP